MNTKMVIAAVLTAAALTGIFSTNPMAVYAEGDDHDGDSSETNTEQKIKQKNDGDGILTNCAQNVLQAGGQENCIEHRGTVVFPQRHKITHIDAVITTAIKSLFSLEFSMSFLVSQRL